MPQKLDLEPIDNTSSLQLEPIKPQVQDEPGNIDLAKQPKVLNPIEGGISTVYSRSYNIDGREVLLPSVTPDGRFLSTDEDVKNEYFKTGRHLGKFSSPESATAYAKKLHEDYESGKYDTTHKNEEKTEKPGFLSRAWKAVSEPLTTAPSRFAESVANYIDEPSLERSPSGAAIRGFFAGATQGAGDLISSLSSPINLTLAALTGGESAAVRAGLPEIAAALKTGARATSIPVVAHGAHETLSPESTMPQRASGLVEIAGGLLGLKGHIPEVGEIKRPLIPREEPAPVMTPEALSSRIDEDIINRRSREPQIPDNPVAQALEERRKSSEPRHPFQQERRQAITPEVLPMGEGLKTREQWVNEGFKVPDYSQVADNGAIWIDNLYGKGSGGYGSEREIAFINDTNRMKRKAGQSVPEEFKQSTKLDLEPVTAAETPKSSKPKYRLDRQSGAFIPIDEAGKQIGPAKFPGKELDPELESKSKYKIHTGLPEEAAKETDIINTDQPGKLQQAYDLARGTMSVDPPFITSASFRQAAPLIGTKNWFKSWVPAAKSFGSEATYDAIMNGITERPLFKSGTVNGVETPSYASQVGLKLSDLGKYTKREEALRGQLAERIPVYGRYVRASNRAYTGFLNSLRADTFENLISDATKEGLNPRNNLELGNQIAEYVNTATSIGKLGAEVGNHEVNLERNARLLSNVFFSPRKISSEIRLLNPSTYIMADPFVRKQYLGSLIRRVGTWWTLAGLAQLAGAQVSKDPTNSDFGKIKIGNTRIDVPGGLQQYLVLGSRIAKGGTTSSTTEKFTPFGQGFKPQTATSTMIQFGANRLHPTAKLAYDLLNATEKAPFHAGDRISQMVLPMYMNDLVEVARENPELSPIILGLSGAGMGTQTYEKGSFGKPVFIPEEYDYNIGAR